MSPEPLAAILAFVGIFISIALSLRTLTWLRLRHIPGPPMAGLTEFWLLRKTLGGRCHRDLLEASKRYGSLVRVGPNHLVTDDPDVLRKMAAVRSPYRRSIWYEGLRLEPDYFNIISERNEARHSDLRAKMAPGYSGKDNEGLEQSIDNNIANLVRLLESKYLSTGTEYRPVDFALKSQFFTLDVISDIAFGKAFGDLENDEDTASIIQTNEETMPMIVLIGAFPFLARIFFAWPFKLLLPNDKDTIGMGKLIRIAKDIAAQRLGLDKEVKKDLIGSFVRHGLTEREVQGETLMAIFAGADTSAAAIRATLLYIITNSHVKSTLLEEIRNSSISNPITDSEARKLPYLQAVIKEGLRIFPPATGIMSKEVPPQGDTINGFFVPGGTTIGWSTFGLMRNVNLWGQDADVFRPERWLEGTHEEMRKREMDLDLVFGYGRYQCLGKNIAYLELNKVFVQLLRNFEFTIVDPSEPWESFNAGLWIHKNMWMRVTKREPVL